MDEVKNLFNFDKINDSAKKISVPAEHVEVEVINPDGTSASGKKRGRPRKESNDNTEVAQNTFIPMCKTNDPYEQTYNETTNILRGSIMQIDQLASEISQDIDSIRKAKTLKGKYTYLANMAATASSLVQTKLTAVREMNSTITKCHELEMKRYKDIKDSKVQQDDDKYLADLYNAYINTPISQGTATPLSLTANSAISNIPMMQNATSLVPPGGMQNDFTQTATPEQNRMLLEGNPNIETVVVYDQATGNKMFDVIDTSTGLPVPNYPRPSQEFLADTNINFGTGVASNSNLGQTWKVVVLGDPMAQF
jgi:hypothetical protein